VERTDNGEFISINELVEFDPKISVKKGAILPYVDMGELSTEGMTVGNIVLKSFAGGSRFENSDTLLARITPCLENGKTAFVDFLEKNQPIGFGSTEFIVMRAKEGISPQFVYCLARDQEFRSFAIQSMVGSSGRQRVQRNMLETYGVPIPQQKLMEKFHQVTASIFSRINTNRIQIKNLSQIRDSLLPKLMSGKIRVI
jgi:type I restriction enzyme S subunit